MPHAPVGERSERLVAAVAEVTRAAPLLGELRALGTLGSLGALGARAADRRRVLAVAVTPVGEGCVRAGAVGRATTVRAPAQVVLVDEAVDELLDLVAARD